MTLTHLRPLVDDRVLRRQFLLYACARVPSGMMLLSLLLHAHQRLGSFTQVGQVAAIYSIVVAVVAPFSGRMADRFGARRQLPLAAVVFAGGIIVLLAAHSLTPLCVGAALAGIGLPPTPACLRGSWRRLHPTTRAAVFGLDGVVLEAAGVIGPLLVAALAALSSPSVSLCLAAAIVVGTALCAAAMLTGTGTADPDDRHWAGPLRIPMMWVLLIVIILITGAIAIIELTAVGYAAHRGTPALSGVLLSAMAIGSVLGGLLFTVRRGARAATDLLPIFCLLSAGGFALLLLARGTPTLIVLLAVSNLAIAPTFATLFTIAGDVAPRSGSVETYAWLSSANFAAIAAGTAVGARLAEHGEPSRAYLTSCAVLVAAALVALAGRRNGGTTAAS